ncbi:MAG TPA: hypothetical protein VNS32_04995 [Flavisolibacter sp.]|nr:hypothetical protein [Flavisolibacter sp.]
MMTEDQDILTTLSESQTKQKRPVVITVVCVIGFLGACISIPLIFSDRAASLGKWYPPLLALSTVLGIISFTGLWKMKKWAVYIYIGTFILGQIALLIMGIWNMFSLVIPAVVISIMVFHLNKME